MDLAKVAQLIATWFAGERIPLFTVGATGMMAHGITRFTIDLDFLTSRDESGKVVSKMEEWGFRTLHGSDSFSNHLHEEQGRVDFIYTDAGTIVKLAERATAMMIGNVELLAPAPEHLIAMKVLAMKNEPARTWKDLADIRLLLEVPGVDLDEVESHFRRHGLEGKFDEVRETL